MALSSEVIMTIVLGREKMMQLMIWIRYNRIKQFGRPFGRITQALEYEFRRLRA